MGYDPDEPSVGSVLLCRFLKMKPLFKGKGQRSKTFLIALQKHLKNEGLERRRVGGSSGFLEYNKELKILMSTPNSAPKCSKGVVWLRSKDNLRWHVFYCSQEGTWKYTYYTTPKPGGSFEMPPTYFETYYFLQDFASTKPLAASILHALRQHNTPMQCCIKICPVAVAEEMKNVAAARDFMIQYLRAHKITIDKSAIKLMFYQFYATNFLNFTLIMHAVGRHLDFFSESKPSLENRVCFSFDLNKQGQSGVGSTGSGYGRGGAGTERFCYALLDWSSSNRTRRRAWTDPSNRQLVGSAFNVAQQEGRDHTTRLTQTIWEFFTNNNGNAINLPDGVEHIDDLAYRRR